MYFIILLYLLLLCFTFSCTPLCTLNLIPDERCVRFVRTRVYTYIQSRPQILPYLLFPSLPLVFEDFLHLFCSAVKKSLRHRKKKRFVDL